MPSMRCAAEVPVILLKQRFLVGRRNSGPSSATDTHTVDAAHGRRHPDGPGALAVLDGVRQQVAEGAAEELGIGMNDRHRRGQLRHQVNTLAGSEKLVEVDHLLRQLVEAHRHVCRLERPAFDGGGVEDVVHHIERLLRRVADAPQVIDTIDLRILFGDLGVAANDRQRVLQVVRQGTDRLAAHFLGAHVHRAHLANGKRGHPGHQHQVDVDDDHRGHRVVRQVCRTAPGAAAS